MPNKSRKNKIGKKRGGKSNNNNTGGLTVGELRETMKELPDETFIEFFDYPQATRIFSAEYNKNDKVLSLS